MRQDTFIWGDNGYQDKEMRMRLRAAQSSEVNEREIKSSKTVPFETKMQRLAQKKRELKHSGLGYENHMPWLNN